MWLEHLDSGNSIHVDFNSSSDLDELETFALNCPEKDYREWKTSGGKIGDIYKIYATTMNDPFVYAKWIGEHTKYEGIIIFRRLTNLEIIELTEETKDENRRKTAVVKSNRYEDTKQEGINQSQGR